MTQEEQMKALIRGAAVENGVDIQFNGYLESLRSMSQQAESEGENNLAAFYMAIAYVGVEAQQ